MDQDSLYHVIDRGLAVPLMLMELWKIGCFWRHAHPQTAVASTLCNAAAIYCFVRSQHAQSAADVEGFILWHNRWHMYPVAVSAVKLYDRLVLSSAPPLLSHQDEPAAAERRPIRRLSSMAMLKAGQQQRKATKVE